MRLYFVGFIVVFAFYQLISMWIDDRGNTSSVKASTNSLKNHDILYAANQPGYTFYTENMDDNDDDDSNHIVTSGRGSATSVVPVPTSISATIENENDYAKPQFRNLRLAFLGDSLTRYQYLSLAYRLRFGRWFDPNIKINNLVSAHSFHHPLHPKEDWNEFFLQSNRMLHPMEICDCLRSHDGSVVLERRYFYDKENNNMLVYINMNGKETSPGHGYYGRLEPSLIFGPGFHDIESLPFGMQSDGSYNDSNIAWDYPTWGDVIRYHIGSLDFDYGLKGTAIEQPHVLLNAGLHPHDFRNDSVASDIEDALVETYLNGIWKTTTYPLPDLIEFQAQLKFSSQSPKRPYTRNTDREMCRILGSCFNISWTSLLKPDLYLDDLHFLEPVYRILNEDYLAQLDLLPQGYKRANRSSILIEGASRWLT